MTWPVAAQVHLDLGLPVIVFDLVYVKAKRLTDGVTEAVGAWTGAEPITLALEGENRTYIGVHANLGVASVETVAGLEVKSHTVTVKGLSDLTSALQLTYDVDQADAEIHQLLMTAGMMVLGARRTFQGKIDGSSLRKSRADGEMQLQVVSKTRRGTRTHAALRDDARDPMFKYSTTTEGDKWG